MEQHTLYRRSRNNDLAWLPPKIEPGQRLTATIVRDDLVHTTTTETIWYHPDDWTPIGRPAQAG